MRAVRRPAWLTRGDVLLELRADGSVAVPSVWGPPALYPDLRAFLAARSTPTRPS